MKTKTITFDFDNTIAMSHMDISGPDVKFIFEEYNEQIVNLIKKYINDGHDVHIVTARDPKKEAMFPKDTVRFHLDRLSLSHYFTDDRVHYTSDTPKLPTLKKLGSTLHYDDNMQEHVDNFGGIPVKHPYDFYPDTEHVAKVVVYDAEDNILLLRRTDEGKAWDIPGGHLKNIEVNRGKSGFEEGLEREVAEETGLILPFAKQIGYSDFTFRGISSKITIYLSKLDTLKPKVNLEMQGHMENSEYRWISMDEMFKFAKNGTQVLRKSIEFAKEHGILTEEGKFQAAMKRKHSKMKKKLVGLGGNKDFGGGKGHTRPKMKRSKSAPPNVGVLEEDDKDSPRVKVKVTNKRTLHGTDLMREELNNIVSQSEFDLSKLQLKSVLHPNFWKNDVLNEDVAIKLEEIAKEFAKDTEIEGKIEDITITGSLASYNYHSKSDIDLHLLVDFEKIGKKGELIKDLMNLMRIKWNETHDIMINGHEVEIYVQDSSEKHYSAGVYSLLSGKWLTKPSPEAKKLDYDAIIDKATSISNEIDEVNAQYHQKDYKKANKMAEKLSEKIKKLRSSGLESDGIYSIENLAFKLLRNSGKMGILMDLRSKSYDKMMSLGEIPLIRVKILKKVDEKRKKRRKKRRKRAKKRRNRGSNWPYIGGYMDSFGADGGDGGGGE